MKEGTRVRHVDEGWVGEITKVLTAEQAFEHSGEHWYLTEMAPPMVFVEWDQREHYEDGFGFEPIGQLRRLE